MTLSITDVPLITLSRKAGETLVRAGQQLLQHGAVRVAQLDKTSAKVIISGEGYGTTTVMVSLNPNDPALPFRFDCKCFETFGKPNRWCAHKYAAALALAQYAEQGTIGNWQGHLAWLLSACAPTKPPAPPAVTLTVPATRPSFLLLFSLQHLRGNWRLTPLVVPLSRVPGSKRDDTEAMAEYIRNTGARLSPQPLPKNADLAALLPADPAQQAAIAALQALPAFADQYDVPADVLYDLLPLLPRALLFHGTPAEPLKRRLRAVAAPGVLQLHLAEHAALLTITPEIHLPDAIVLPVRTEKLRVLSTGSACCIAGDLLFTVPVSAEGIKALADRPSAEIPAGERACFAQDYLARLARVFPLCGEGVACREWQAPPLPRLALEDAAGHLTLRFRFAYGEWEYPRVTSTANPVRLEVAAGDGTLVRIARDFAAEACALAALAAVGIVPDAFGDRYELTSGLSLTRLLFEVIPALRAQGFEVVGDDTLRSVRVLRGAPEISLRVSSKIDWFDLSGVLHLGELQMSLQELRRGLHAHEGYITCPDGSIVVLPPEWWRSLRFLLGMAGEDGDRLRVPRRQAMALDLALAEFAQVAADADFSACRTRLRAFAQIARRPLPANFHGELRPYQQGGYDWLHFLHDFELGGCLADDMGLGKTVQALVFLQSLHENGHAQHADLIVMPRSLLFNWQREIARFTPELRVLIHADNNRVQDHADFEQYDLILTTYGVMMRDMALLQSYPFHYLILDEAQAIKNPHAQTSRTACCLRAEHRLTLTGTPVENGVLELWSQFHFLNPGLLGTQDYFRDEFSIPIEKQGDAQAARFLQRLVYPFICRRTKEQAAPDLPPRSERLVYNSMEPAQRALYEKTREHYRESLLGQISVEGLHRSRMHILEALLRLRQICLHPRMIDAEYTGASAKLEQVLETLETLHAEGHKALIFSQFTRMLTIVREALDARCIRYAYLDGRTKDRQAHVDAFQQDEHLPFFLISLKAGGVGLNLTAADYVLHLDPWWNPAVERQATDRTHRIGQQRPVFVSKFITEDSVEEKIVQLQERKRALTEQLITTETGFFKSLTSEDVAGLFS